MLVIQFQRKKVFKLTKTFGIIKTSAYLWSYSVNDDQLLIRDSRQGVSKTAAKNKKCYYSYYYTARSYYAAVAECQKKGNGYDLASFQAVFEFKGTELVNYGLAGKSYDNIV